MLASLRALPPLIADGHVPTVVVRGPAGERSPDPARRARAASGRGVLALGRVRDGERAARARRARSPPCCTPCPCSSWISVPAETAELTRPPALDGPLGVVLGRQGGLGGAPSTGAITLALGLPDAAAAAPRTGRPASRAAPAPTSDELAARFRMTGGNIRRVARLARARRRRSTAAVPSPPPTCAAPAARSGARPSTRSRSRCRRPGDWGRLAVDERTREELTLLELRCRHRERLRSGATRRATPACARCSPGPSGTGKTLAARVLASALAARPLPARPLDRRQQVHRGDGEEPQPGLRPRRGARRRRCCSTRATRC